jgi:general secretion pathway protein D
MLDIPAARGRHIGMFNLDFITPEQFKNEVNELLNSEGLLSAVGSSDESNVVMIPLERLGAVAVFSSTKYLLDRVGYWASLVDVAGNGNDQQYFFYQPKFARATDLYSSISALIGGPRNQGQMSGGQVTSASNENTGSAPSSMRNSGFQSDAMTLVVDERSNALVFYTTGSKYRALFPLLARLDSLPKQVALEITIAEVTLKDQFANGFEWAWSRGEVGLSTQGAFGATEIGGMGLFIDGTEGVVSANFLSSNSLVNVLSRPTLTVRDGVSASINVGSSISVVGSTTTDPINGERQTTTSEYRQTGVDVAVTPTVNAQGIISMEVTQTISNTVPSSSGAAGIQIYLSDH